MTKLNDAYRTADPIPRGAQPVKVQPIAVPTIPVEEIREVTKGFGDEALIGEGSFRRVYFGVLKNGRSAAIKKLGSSKQPEQEFLAQVSMVSRLNHDNVVELLGYCVDGNTLAAVAALCVQYEADFRPNMSIVVKALQPLLNARASNNLGEHSGS